MIRAIKPVLGSLLLVLLVLIAVQGARAAEQESQIEEFANRVGQIAYAIAWPTATYQGWQYVGIASNAYEVDLTIRLEGRSGWDDSYLWTDATFIFRSDESLALRFGRNNAELVPPGVTFNNVSGALNNYLAQMANQH
jgi:hypothetical protein